MEWKSTEYKGYDVSNTGLVRSVGRNKHNKILKPVLNHKGYEVVYLSVKEENNYRKSPLVHRLVAKAFVPNLENKPQVNHKDGNKLNNNADNLEWVTNFENHTHKLENNLMPATHSPKRVGKFDKEGNLLETFDSIYSAGKSVGSTQYNVSRVVNGLRKTFKGFVWRYIE